MPPQVPEDADGLAVWLKAQGAFASCLSQFQLTNPRAKTMAMEDVLEAIQPAMALGFCYSIQWLDPESCQVRLMHASGWDLVSYLKPNESPWQALADLLGVPTNGAAQQPPAAALAVVPEPAPEPTPEPPAPASLPDPDEFGDADLMGEGTPDSPVLPEDRQALSEADREFCLAMIRNLTAEQRKQFTIAFRSHFNVDKSQRTISPSIVQMQHQKFIQSFVDELELAGEAA